MGTDGPERDTVSTTGALSVSGALRAGECEGRPGQSSVDTHAPPGAGEAAARRRNSGGAGVWVQGVCARACVPLPDRTHTCICWLSPYRSAGTHLHISCVPMHTYSGL